MATKVLVVEDDRINLAVIEKILSGNGLVPTCFDNAKDALKSFESNVFDIILSDYVMPGMDGKEFLRQVRLKNREIPFIVVTANSDINVATELIKEGADDHLLKPIDPDTLIFRITKNIKEKESNMIIRRIEREKEILEYEKKSLANWKLLYATKDTKQAEQIVEILTRTINQSGGFIWLDILKSGLETIDEEYYKISKAVVDLIINSSESNQLFFNNITYISNLENLEIPSTPLPLPQFISEITSFIDDSMVAICSKYERKLFIQDFDHNISGNISISQNYFNKVLKELILNAIKYSEEKSPIELLIDKRKDGGKSYLEVSVKNSQRPLVARDREGETIVGIPNEYSELIFDLFYTIEAFPNQLPEEEWNNGTGLFIARRIISKQGGWIKTAAGVDYTVTPSTTYQKFTITLPYELG